jgi:tetratricopeptide (TPR) repeat protein
MHLQAVVAAKTGRTALAIRLLRELLSVDPKSVEAWNELATQLRMAGRTAESITASEQAIQLRANDVSAHNNLGLCHLAQRRLPDAAASIERAIAAAPATAALHLNLGFIRQRQGQNRDAADSYRAAVALAPNYAEAHARLGQVLLMQGQRDKALECFQHAASMIPANSPEAGLQIAGILLAVNQVESAEDLLRRVVTHNPKSGLARLHLGRVLQQRGLFADAISNFEGALNLQPELLTAWLGIATCDKVTDRALVQRLTTALRQQTRNVETADLHYALGKALDDLNDLAPAMRHYDEANRLAGVRLNQSGKPIDLHHHAATIDQLIARFTPDVFARCALSSPDDELPILIVGMIRSGTTLLEQIVSSHRAVGAGGELPFWSERAQNAVAAIDSTLGQRALGDLAADYCALLRSLAPGAERVTDKMPTNFLLLGLIHLILPRARIIHCGRHPADTCLSIYLTPYQRSPDFAHNRETIVKYYREYERVMAHWRAALPRDRFLEVSYEDLVTNRESVTRNIIAFCGLDWDDACLRPEKNTRNIATPSMWQTRQPVYRSSLQRWRRYEPWLGEFRQLLTDKDVGQFP